MSGFQSCQTFNLSPELLHMIFVNECLKCKDNFCFALLNGNVRSLTWHLQFSESLRSFDFFLYALKENKEKL